LERRVRAFDPSPGAYLEMAGIRVKVCRGGGDFDVDSLPPGPSAPDLTSFYRCSAPDLIQKGYSQIMVVENFEQQWGSIIK